MMRLRPIVAAGLLTLAACAIRLGGPKPVEYRVLALNAGDESDPAMVAQRVRGTGANVVLLAAPRDSAWFAGVAEGTRLALSGPGVRAGNGLAFLAGEPVGDTTIALPTGSGESAPTVLVHDALYEVDDERYLDLMAVRIDPGQDVNAVVQALLQYVATDVMPNAAVALAVDLADGDAGGRIARLLDPAFADARECMRESREDGGRRASGTRGWAEEVQPGLLLFYGPELQMSCDRAELRRELGSAIMANLVVNR